MKDDNNVDEFLKTLDVISMMGLLTMINHELGIYPELVCKCNPFCHNIDV